MKILDSKQLQVQAENLSPNTYSFRPFDQMGSVLTVCGCGDQAAIHPSEINTQRPEKNVHPLIWIRDEVKPGEHRVPVTPKNAKRLMDAGYRVYIEGSTTRCIDDSEYTEIGCTLVESGSWVTDAPDSAFIFGIKELPEEPQKLKHRHIYFAHAFKGQNEAVPLLKRFKAVKSRIVSFDRNTACNKMTAFDQNQRRFANLNFRSLFT